MVPPARSGRRSRDEAAAYVAALEGAGAPRGGTLLELGAGAGGNASFVKRNFRCTLTDLSPGMLALSRALNPECEHLPGDMRTLRLQRQFDAVLVHDAVAYMTTRADLAAAVATAFAHTRPAAPPCSRPITSANRSANGRSFTPVTRAAFASVHRVDLGSRSGRRNLRRRVRVPAARRRRHQGRPRPPRRGMFARATWVEILSGAGYRVDLVDRPFDDTTTDQTRLPPALARDRAASRR